MAKERKKTGRKSEFPDEESDRLSIRLPKNTIVELEVYTARSPLSRNQVINQAILDLVKKQSK